MGIEADTPPHRIWATIGVSASTGGTCGRIPDCARAGRRGFPTGRIKDHNDQLAADLAERQATAVTQKVSIRSGRLAWRAGDFL